MTFGEDWGWGAPKEECARVVRTFAEAGGNFIDTANAYTNGTSERIVGELISGERDRWVVSTKYVCSQDFGDPNAGGAHRKSMIRALDASLQRLQTDYIDLYWVHVWDPFTPVEEVVRALDDVVSAGKVRYVGVSDTPAWVVSQAVTLADLRGWTRFAGLQVPYSLIRRDVERDLLPMAKTLDLAVTTFEPLGGGLLTGRYGTDRSQPADTRIGTAAEYADQKLTDRNLEITDTLNEVAAGRNAHPAQVALAWVLSQQARSVIVPIVGARRHEQLAATLTATQIVLAADELRTLNDASAIELGFPHDFEGRALAHGETYELVDDHRGHVWPPITNRPLVATAD
jgi:aryl-alcohol dehydrogenase-like predicted oxidoreductase